MSIYEDYEKETLELLRRFAEIAIETPDRIGSVREVLKTSASLLVTNVPALKKITKNSAKNWMLFSALVSWGKLILSYLSKRRSPKTQMLNNQL